MATAKEQLNSHYHWRLEDAYSNWRANKVIPFSRAYADAFKAYEKTRGDAEKELQARAELYIAVAMIAGSAFLGLGPIAGIIASGKRAARIGNIAIANAVGRLGVVDRAQAWVVMKKFTFGGLPQFTSAVWDSHGKELVKNKLTTFAMDGVAQVTSPAGSATQGVRESGTQLPIEYYLMLEGLLLKARNAVANTAQSMVDDTNVSEAQLEEYWKQTIGGNFIKKAPKVLPSDTDLVRLANEMELALWAMAALEWRWQRTVQRRFPDDLPGRGPTWVETVTEYSAYLESDKVLERVDKLMKDLGEHRYIMTYQESRNAQGQRVLRSNSVRTLNESWDDHFGAWHSDGEKNTFLDWAHTYVVERANKVMVPTDFT